MRVTGPLTTARNCGSCTFCCKVMEVTELQKPLGKWCAHCRPGAGCSIYPDRPRSCREYVCAWLVDPSVPEAMRPDRSKVVLDANGEDGRLEAVCDPADPTAWTREPMRGALKGLAAEGRKVIAIAGRRAWIIGPKNDVDLGQIEPHWRIEASQLSDGTIRAQVFPPDRVAGQT